MDNLCDPQETVSILNVVFYIHIHIHTYTSSLVNLAQCFISTDWGTWSIIHMNLEPLSAERFTENVRAWLVVICCADNMVHNFMCSSSCPKVIPPVGYECNGGVYWFWFCFWGRRYPAAILLDPWNTSPLGLAVILKTWSMCLLSAHSVHSYSGCCIGERLRCLAICIEIRPFF